MIFSIENPMPQGHNLIPFLMQQIFSFPETYIFQFQPGLHICQSCTTPQRQLTAKLLKFVAILYKFSLEMCG